MADCVTLRANIWVINTGNIILFVLVVRFENKQIIRGTILVGIDYLH